MNIDHLRLRLFCTLGSALFLCATDTFAQGGPLEPPGPPAVGVYKTLQEVEPRTALFQGINTPAVGSTESDVFVIKQPGSYYLTGNIKLPDVEEGLAIGVLVESSGVTLDLNGFEIVGNGRATVDYGVIVLPPAVQVKIVNGMIRDCDTGIFSYEDNGSADSIRVRDCEFGIRVESYWTINDCHVENSNYAGFSVDSYSTIKASSSRLVLNGDGFFCSSRVTISDCISYSSRNGFRGGALCTVRNSLVIFSGDSGFQFGQSAVIEDCRVEDGDGGISTSADSQVSRCHVWGGGTVTVGANSTVREVEVHDPATDAFRTSGTGAQFIECLAQSSADDGFLLHPGTRVVDCRSIGNAGHGFYIESPSASAAGGSLKGCLAENNTGDGIFVTAGTGHTLTNLVISDCEVRNNGTHGIRLLRVGASQVISNHVSGPGSFGITDPGTPSGNGNIFFDNIAIGFTNAFVFDGNSSWGTVSLLGAGSMGTGPISPRPNLYR